MSSQRPRRRYSDEQLAVLYLVTGCAAAVAGVLTSAVGLAVLSALKVGCHRITGGDVPPGGELYCPDGTAKVLPALVLAGLGGIAVLAAAAALVSRRADASTIRQVSRHTMWLATAVVALPGTAWVILAPIPAVAAAALPAIAFAAIPLVTSYVWPTRTAVVLSGCLAVPVAVLLVGRQLPLLVPIVLPLAAVWLIALWLLRAARRLHSPRYPAGLGSPSSPR